MLLLGRTSNLPTVWSNCLAAWLLAGGGLTESGEVQRFVWLNVGATLLYLAGMFLNDAFDVKFDREHRAERPIPSGAISVKAVWTLGVGQMILGLACVVWVNVPAAACALALVGSILWYDWVHKKIAWSPLIMGLCRLFLYLLTGAIAVGEITLPVLLGGIALWVYIVGLSNIARKEATKGSVNSWPCWLLALPLFFGLRSAVFGRKPFTNRSRTRGGCTHLPAMDDSKSPIYFQVHDSPIRSHGVWLVGRARAFRLPPRRKPKSATWSGVFRFVCLFTYFSKIHPGNLIFFWLLVQFGSTFSL